MHAMGCAQIGAIRADMGRVRKWGDPIFWRPIFQRFSAARRKSGLLYCTRKPSNSAKKRS